MASPAAYPNRGRTSCWPGCRSWLASALWFIAVVILVLILQRHIDTLFDKAAGEPLKLEKKEWRNYVNYGSLAIILIDALALFFNFFASGKTMDCLTRTCCAGDGCCSRFQKFLGLSILRLSYILTYLIIPVVLALVTLTTAVAFGLKIVGSLCEANVSAVELDYILKKLNVNTQGVDIATQGDEYIQKFCGAWGGLSKKFPYNILWACLATLAQFNFNTTVFSHLWNVHHQLNKNEAVHEVEEEVHEKDLELPIAHVGSNQTKQQ